MFIPDGLLVRKWTRSFPREKTYRSVCVAAFASQSLRATLACTGLLSLSVSPATGVATPSNARHATPTLNTARVRFRSLRRASRERIYGRVRRKLPHVEGEGSIDAFSPVRPETPSRNKSRRTKEKKKERKKEKKRGGSFDDDSIGGLVDLPSPSSFSFYFRNPTCSRFVCRLVSETDDLFMQRASGRPRLICDIVAPATNENLVTHCVCTPPSKVLNRLSLSVFIPLSLSLSFFLAFSRGTSSIGEFKIIIDR